MDYQPTIGLECHVQLGTRSKMFCGCPVPADLSTCRPNTLVCPVCLGHPGTLPRVNAEAVALAIRAALAVGGRVEPLSRFDRKHYFYPDLPKGYQITQVDAPLCTGAALHVLMEGEPHRFAIERMHLEEDTGRMHHAADGTGVDWNRCGTPLLEVVGAPDLHSPEAAVAWLRGLHRVLVTAGVTPGDLEKGHLRCDANVSVAPVGSSPGARVELKNLNSFRFLARALRFEIERQVNCLRAGGEVLRETRAWNGKRTTPLRDKERAADYRYLPEPDLPPLRITPAELAAERARLPGMPLDRWLLEQDTARLDAFVDRYGLDRRTARILVEDARVREIYEAAVNAGGPALPLARWVIGPLRRLVKAEGGPGALEPEHLVAVQALVAEGKVNRNGARTLLAEAVRTGADPLETLRRRGLARIVDEQAIREVVRDVVAEHPTAAARYRAGRHNVVSFFMGCVMRRFAGRADPQLAERVIREALDSG